MAPDPTLVALVKAAAQRHGINPALYEGVIQQESGWNQGSHSGAGAIGLSQLMPGTAKSLGVNPYDASQNVEGGAKFLAQELKAYHGNAELALAAYNAGPGAVAKYHGVPPYAETQDYIGKVLGYAKGYGYDGRALKTANELLTSAGQPPLAQTPDTAAPDQNAQAHQTLVQSVIDANSKLAHIRPLTMPALPAMPSAGSAPGSAMAPAPAGPAPTSPAAHTAADIAQKFIGTPYVWGGSTPKGFDCSGLVQYAYAQLGKQVPRTSQEQWKGGTPVDPAHLQKGDLVFFVGSDGTRGAPGHVGIYLGAGQFIQAPHTGATVQVSNLAGRSDFVGARRY